MKKLLYVTLAIIAALGLASCGAPEAVKSPSPEVSVSPVVTPEAVVFADAALEMKVRKVMGKPTGDITFAEAEAVTELDLSNEWQENMPEEKIIRNLSGLEYFTNVTYLNLTFNCFDDLSPLSNLKKLERLCIGGNAVSDLTPLSGMDLGELHAWGNYELRDISPLSGMAHMHVLMLGECPVENIDAVSGMKELGILDIANCQVKTLWPIAGLPLWRLNISGCPIDSYAPLKDIIDGLQEKDFELLPAAQNPDEVIVFTDPVMEKKVREATGILDGDITAGDAALVLRLDLSNELADNVSRDVKFSDLGGIEYFINLKVLSICLNEVSDISALSGLTQMEDLNIGINQISDLSALSGMAALKHLTAFGNQISDLSPIAGMSLDSLHIGNNQVSDISALSGMTEMTTLYMSGNQISDISALSGMTKLRSLELANNPVTDFSPIADIYPNIENKDFEMK